MLDEHIASWEKYIEDQQIKKIEVKAKSLSSFYKKQIEDLDKVIEVNKKIREHNKEVIKSTDEVLESTKKLIADSDITIAAYRKMNTRLDSIEKQLEALAGLPISISHTTTELNHLNENGNENIAHLAEQITGLAATSGTLQSSKVTADFLYVPGSFTSAPPNSVVFTLAVTNEQNNLLRYIDRFQRAAPHELIGIWEEIKALGKSKDLQVITMLYESMINKDPSIVLKVAEFLIEINVLDCVRGKLKLYTDEDEDETIQASAKALLERLTLAESKLNKASSNANDEPTPVEEKPTEKTALGFVPG